MPTPRKDAVGSAQATTSADDDRLRLTTWTFEDGEETGYHRHEFDYVVVPVSGGTFDVVDKDGAIRTMTQEAATAYVGAAGTEHNVINRSGCTTTFVEIELKR